MDLKWISEKVVRLSNEAIEVECADKNSTRGLGFNSAKTNPAVTAGFSEMLSDNNLFIVFPFCDAQQSPAAPARPITWHRSSVQEQVVAIR